MSDDPGIAPEYDVRLPLYQRLEEEAVFVLSAALESAGIKSHSVSSRVKTLSSLEDKSARKGYRNPLNEASDIVGTRIVTLFLSDLPQVREIVKDRFDVVASDDKIGDSDPSTFGYMSEHYVVRLGTTYQGARYDDIQDTPFEVQIRTILMDAWANVSHYLAYKGEASVPADLRKDFHALSGLFYVADQHFEMFFKGAMESRSNATANIEEGGADTEINLETLGVLLQKQYPDRKHAPRSSISEVVEEITECGYENLGAIAETLELADDLVKEYEREHPPGAAGDGRYSDVGAVRKALAISDAKYARRKYHSDTPFERYRRMLSSSA
ncbi:MAG TPA: hypothetical protein VEW67_05980 [Thermoleophilaceae bacterium]|nr:hypothetical protein [Thermoleophilaceae bacterium]